jgi:hypothetical protein
MSSADPAFFSANELLGGLPARRASTVLFAIESRTAHLVRLSRQAAAPYLAEATAASRERSFLQALAQGRQLEAPPTIQALERHAPEWAALVPSDAGLRAAAARLLAAKHRFTQVQIPRLCTALGLDDLTVQQAYLRLYRQPLSSIYAETLTTRERLRWAQARLAYRLEDLPPFWTTFALTLTETVGAGILALPIALAGVGPLAGVVLLIALGLVNLVTIAAVSEAAAANGNLRHGPAYFGRLVSDYLGPAGVALLTAALLALLVMLLLAYYVGFSKTLAGATALPAWIWAALLFGLQVYFVRRESLSATIASALIIGFVNIGLLLILSLLALPHIRSAHLRYVNLPGLQGSPFDPAILGLIFGVILAGYFGHLSTGACARLVLRRDPSGRALIWGNLAAMATAIGLCVVWVIAVNGAIAPSVLAAETGTALTPLAEVAGPLVHVFGALFVILGMGMGSIHMSLALYNQVREWRLAAGRSGRASLAWVQHSRAGPLLDWLPVAAIFLLAEWQLLTRQESFTGLFWIFAIIVPVLAGVLPMLMLAASRRKGDYAPAAAIAWLGHPLVIIGVYVLFLGSVFLHGLVIWQAADQRAAALLAGLAILGATLFAVARGALRARGVVELRMEQLADERAFFSLVAAGKPLEADVRLVYRTGENQLHASQGELPDAISLRSVTFSLPILRARQLKVWVHRLTQTGVSEALSVGVTVTQGGDNRPTSVDGSSGQYFAALSEAPCEVYVMLA